MTIPVAAIPWYKSPQTIGLITTAVSAAVALFPKVGQLLGLTSPTSISDAVSSAATVIALIAPVVGAIFRVKSKDQPITLTQAAADNHEVTVLAERTAELNAQNAHTAALLAAVTAKRKAEAAAAAATTQPIPIDEDPAPLKVDPSKPWGK